MKTSQQNSYNTQHNVTGWMNSISAHIGTEPVLKMKLPEYDAEDLFDAFLTELPDLGGLRGSVAYNTKANRKWFKKYGTACIVGEDGNLVSIFDSEYIPRFFVDAVSLVISKLEVETLTEVLCVLPSKRVSKTHIFKGNDNDNCFGERFHRDIL